MASLSEEYCNNKLTKGWPVLRGHRRDASAVLAAAPEAFGSAQRKQFGRAYLLPCPTLLLTAGSCPTASSPPARGIGIRISQVAAEQVIKSDAIVQPNRMITCHNLAMQLREPLLGEGARMPLLSPSRDPVGIAAARTALSSGHALPSHTGGRRPVPRDHGYPLPSNRDHPERYQSGLLGKPALTSSGQSTVPRTSARSMWKDGNEQLLSRCGARTVSPCTARLCT